MEVLFARRAGHPALGKRLALGCLWFGALVCATRAAGAQESADVAPPPHFDARIQTPQYVGPRDERSDAAALHEVRIGYFGPSDEQHPLHGPAWHGARQAVEEANRRGGYHGKPYRLVTAWSEDPWGSGVKQIVQLVYRDHVWAIVGGVDGPTTHLAEQVVVKARLALVSPVSTDKTVNLTNVPWMFSLAPNDRQVAALLADELARRPHGRRLGLITTNDHDAFHLTRELRRAMTERQINLGFQFEYQPPTQTAELLAQECLAREPDELLVIANPLDSLQLVRAVRKAGFAHRIYGGPAFGRAPFTRGVGSSSGELVFPRMDEARATAPTDNNVLSPPLTDDTAEDYATRHTYDAVSIVIAAIERAGLSRTDIARAIRDRPPIAGRSGRIEWDPPGNNTRPPSLATLVEGQVTPLAVK